MRQRPQFLKRIPRDRPWQKRDLDQMQTVQDQLERSASHPRHTCHSQKPRTPWRSVLPWGHGRKNKTQAHASTRKCMLRHISKFLKKQDTTSCNRLNTTTAPSKYSAKTSIVRSPTPCAKIRSKTLDSSVRDFGTFTPCAGKSCFSSLGRPLPETIRMVTGLGQDHPHGLPIRTVCRSCFNHERRWCSLRLGAATEARSAGKLQARSAGKPPGTIQGERALESNALESRCCARVNFHRMNCWAFLHLPGTQAKLDAK